MASSDELEAFSLSLSEIMDDIGVNEDVVIRRRRKCMATETIEILAHTLRNKVIRKYYFGSLVEGTTTRGMDSDSDNLICFKYYTVIQSLDQWKFGTNTTLLMIEDEITPPGYCNLQLLESAVAKPATKPIQGLEEEFIIDNKGRVLLSNHIMNKYLTTQNDYRHGPCWATKGKAGFVDQDTALAMACEWPPCALDWFDEQSNSGWPTDHMKAYCRDRHCFLVPVGKKGSPNQETQWRISTSLAERCLMFNLNVTQIRCYILMNMILKTHLKSYVNKELTSFMCKTILFHCVRKYNPELWQEKKLFLCLAHCLIHMYHSVIAESCPHFFIRSNNLMENNFSAESKIHITYRLHAIILDLHNKILDIEYDGLNIKLAWKCGLIQNLFLGMCSEEVCESFTCEFRNERFEYHLQISGLISFGIGKFLSELHQLYLYQVETNASDELKILTEILETIMKPFGQIKELDTETRKLIASFAKAIYHASILHRNRPVHGSLTDVHRFLFYSLKTLVYLYRQDISQLERFACLTLTRVVCSQLIFIKVCLDLENCSKHSLEMHPEIFQSFDLPIDIDVASYKLKMSSVFYCTGHVREANQILEEVENRYQLDKVEPICGCHDISILTRRIRFNAISYLQNEQATKEVAAFCVRFVPCEIRIVPKELQYEMFRSTKQDIKNRSKLDYWCDYAGVDSLIFLYFLQYKVSRGQKNLKDQELALTRLALATVTEANLGHRETAWNLLGQCLEYESKARGALHCYALSLRIRQQNNAARILICRLLSRKINKRKPAKHAGTS